MVSDSVVPAGTKIAAIFAKHCAHASFGAVAVACEGVGDRVRRDWGRVSGFVGISIGVARSSRAGAPEPDRARRVRKRNPLGYGREP